MEHGPHESPGSKSDGGRPIPVLPKSLLSRVYARTFEGATVAVLSFLTGVWVLFSRAGPPSFFGGMVGMTFALVVGVASAVTGLALGRLLWKRTERFPLGMLVHAVLLAACLTAFAWLIVRVLNEPG
jgi:hypothetical protein